jgi:hypothetical protein
MRGAGSALHGRATMKVRALFNGAVGAGVLTVGLLGAAGAVTSSADDDGVPAAVDRVVPDRSGLPGEGPPGPAAPRVPAQRVR